MGQLLFATEKFFLNGASRPGVPFLVDSQMKIREAPSEWLISLATSGAGTTYASMTLRTYGEALYDFFETVDASKWKWDEVDSDDLDLYATKLTNEESEHTKRRLAVKTVNLRLTVVAQFYEWAVARGLISESPVRYKLVRTRNEGPLLHISGRQFRKQNTHLVRDETREPTALSPEQLRTVLNALGPRDRLIADCAVTSGARRMELCAFDVQDWKPLKETKSAIGIRPPKAKRNNKALLWFPKPIFERVKRYIVEERSTVVSKTGSKSPALFLSKEGRRVRKERLTQIFYRLSAFLGFSVAFHELRHTFATRVADVLIKQQGTFDHGSRANAALILKVLMRHKSIRSSLIYVHTAKADPELLAYAVLEAYSGWL